MMRSLLILLLLAVAPARAATIVASSTSAADVQTAVDASSNGDTVSVPAGSSTWTTDVETGDKRITIQGAGHSSTIITVNLTFYGLYIQGPVRLTGVKMIMTAGAGLIQAKGLGYRIDHCRFEASSQVTAIIIIGWDINSASYGLVDQCEFVNCSAIATGYDLQDYVRWAEPNTFGTTNVNVFERNTYVNTVFNNSMDANYSGKYVFRHNTVIDSSLEAHSVQGGGRGTKSWEIYKNTLIQSNRSMNFPFYIRAGTGVICSNTIYGSWSNPDGYLNNIRSVELRFGAAGYDPFPLNADGGSTIDGNLTNNIAQATGSHSGSGNSAFLEDSSRTWTANQFRLSHFGTHTTGSEVNYLEDSTKGFVTDEYIGYSLVMIAGTWDGYRFTVTGNTATRISYTATNTLAVGAEYYITKDTGYSRWVYNLTDGSKGRILSNTTTRIYVTLTGGTDNDWDVSDSYKITDGYPALDQIGRGYDSSQGAALTFYPQVSEIAHIWENRTSGGTLLNLRISGGNNSDTHIVAGREYTNGLAKSGWAPLTYPHPRAVAEDGQGVSVVPASGVAVAKGKPF